MWSSRYYYENCTHFGAYVAPQSSIASDAGVDFYILECRGPGLPLAGEYALEVLKSPALATGRLPRVESAFHFVFLGAGVLVCAREIQHRNLHAFHFSFRRPLTGVHSAKTHRLIRVLYDTRKQFASKLDEIALPKQESFDIQLTHGTRAAVQIQYPPSWRKELRDAAYPVIVEV